MINLLIDGARYLMILMMAVYTYLNFRYFRVGEEEKKHTLCSRQNRLMFLMHLLAYLVICLKTEDPRMAVFYIAQVVFFLAYILLYRLFYPDSSRILVNNVCMLLCVGLIILSRLSFARAARQFIIAAIGAAVTWLVPLLISRLWQLSKIPWAYSLTGLGLLVIVHFVGNTSFGAQLSITVAGVSVQPSEFVKIIFVFFVASMFYQATGFKQVMVTTVVAGLHVLILVASKDLGSGLIFFVTYLSMLFAATSNWFYLGAGMMGGWGAAVLAYRLFSHVRVRVSAWKNPWADIDNTGYQITQSLFAIGTGSWLGMGLYQGMPKKIPVVDKDFVFAAISEEMGALFAICVLLICLGCFLQFIMIACEMEAAFYRLLAFGLGMMYATQVFLAVGGTLKFIPSTGVTLPFVSYGGSSVVSTWLMFGVIQGLYVLKRQDAE